MSDHAVILQMKPTALVHVKFWAATLGAIAAILPFLAGLTMVFDPLVARANLGS